MTERMVELNMEAEVKHFRNLPKETQRAIIKASDDDMIVDELAVRLVELRALSNAVKQLGKVKV